LNLTRCNNDPPPFPELEEVCFQKILNAQEDFGLKSLAPEEVYDFINRMVCDNELFSTYQKLDDKKTFFKSKIEHCILSEW
jgi:hypothetical protein